MCQSAPEFLQGNNKCANRPEYCLSQTSVLPLVVPVKMNHCLLQAVIYWEDTNQLFVVGR